MIRIEQARKLLKAAMETQGRDFVYCIAGAPCSYEPINSHNGVKLHPDDNRRKTGCLVGVALDLAGETVHHHHRGSVTSLTRHHSHMMSMRARDYFQVAQKSQDNGESWGCAYDKAERLYQEWMPFVDE